MLYHYMVADVEPILWQMLLPIFNNVADVNTTYFSRYWVLYETFMAGVVAIVADGIAT